MKRKQDEVYFEQGWVKFVEDNSLSDGDFLTFVYNGDRIFEVSIYGPDGCKEVRAVTEADDDEEDSSNDTDAISESEVVTTIPRSKNKGKSKVGVVEESDDDEEDSIYTDTETETDTGFPGKSKLTEDVDDSVKLQRERVKPKIKNPEAYLDNPRNIYFETGVKKRIYELLIHAQLVKDYSLKFEKNIYYIDNHKNGKLEAKTTMWKDQRVYIKKWQRICKRNSLKKEDGILCELFRRQGLVYAVKVHIIREKDL
ncbi:hypothetical protein EUTSA_v10026054mg [Eutrema salsugineum]|uniref:TF-B3 domain-containing protein n=2 Tax=Eutrema salsugineum TaxID=72664 RepID=V4MBB8_EUTSA|nr:hypothetical protein EUTSA_v10026054mg [Eutrema salsugineum]